MSGARVRAVTLSLALVLGLPACAVPATGTPSGASAPQTPTARPSPTASLEAAIDELTLVPGDAVGDWWAVGLVGNHYDMPVLLASVWVTLADEAGSVLAEQETLVSVRRLLPEEQSPFAILFSDIPEAVSAHAQAPAEPAASFRRARVEVEDLRTWPEVQGGWVTIGRLVNRSNAPALIEGVALLARRSSGLAAGVTRSGASCSYLRPEEACLFVAELPATQAPLELTAFVDAAQSPSVSSPSITFPDAARLFADARGHPLVLGSLRNEEDRPMWVAVQATLRRGEEALSAGWVTPPVPVAPGETRAFALTDFPGWEALVAGAEWTLDDIEVDLWTDPIRTVAAEAERTSLEAQVTQFEQVSDRLFLRGSLRNGWTTVVRQPSALATVRRTDGRLVTAGWVTVGGALAPEESRAFLLVLPLPPRSDVAMAEFDLIGAGLSP